MNAMKKFLIQEFEKLSQIRQASDFPIVYFRLFQLVTIFITIAFAFSSLGLLGFAGIGRILNCILWAALNLLAAEVGLRLIVQSQATGVAVGLILAILHTFSIQFLLSLFGFYAFLNPASQKRYLRSTPPWVKEALKVLRIHWLDE
jgi:hypothetical protein